MFGNMISGLLYQVLDECIKWRFEQQYLYLDIVYIHDYNGYNNINASSRGEFPYHYQPYLTNLQHLHIQYPQAHLIC